MSASAVEGKPGGDGGGVTRRAVLIGLGLLVVLVPTGREIPQLLRRSAGGRTAEATMGRGV